jgi:hypothetical protein
VSVDFPPSFGRSLSTSNLPPLLATELPLCCQWFTSCYFRKSFVFTLICVAPRCAIAVFHFKPSTVNCPVTPLFAALPYVSALTPLSTAFTRLHPSARVVLRYFRRPSTHLTGHVPRVYPERNRGTSSLSPHLRAIIPAPVPPCRLRGRSA